MKEKQLDNQCSQWVEISALKPVLRSQSIFVQLRLQLVKSFGSGSSL
jgi:hypothetical protein